MSESIERIRAIWKELPGLRRAVISSISAGDASKWRIARREYIKARRAYYEARAEARAERKEQRAKLKKQRGGR